jgi:hypothetical protein
MKRRIEEALVDEEEHGVSLSMFLIVCSSYTTLEYTFDIEGYC